MLLLAQSDAQLTETLEVELAEVGNRFAAELISDLTCVNALVSHIERYRGKMLRPTLVLVSGMASNCAHVEVATDGSPLTDAHRVVATVVELVHMATLVHDDVLDEALTRRRGHTVNQLNGNETAVMLGDYLISHAYHLCSSLDRPSINHQIADATNVVCEGELLQLSNRDNWDLDEETYFQIIERKTASLCGTCCRVAAILNEAGIDTVEGLYNYGQKLGIAYQIVDDVLDLMGTEQKVGKTLGRDLEKGKLTLPLIHFLRRSAPAQRRQALDLIRPDPALGDDPSMTRQQMDQVRRLLEPAGSVAYANKWAGSLIEQAKVSVQHLPDSASRQMLMSMADAVLTRQF